MHDGDYKAAVANGVAPEKVKKRIESSTRAILSDEPNWQVALAFYGNDQYVEVSAVTNTVDRLEVREGGTKPRWRPRLTRNRMTSRVVGEVSLLSSRTPDYGVDAPIGDPRAINQAQLAEIVLRHLHRQLNVQKQIAKTLIYSILTGGGWLYPQWNPKLGNYLGQHPEDGTPLAEGDIEVKVLHQGEVLWDENCAWEDSDYFMIRKAKSEEATREYAEINHDKITTDAQPGLWEKAGTENRQLCFVYEYFEKPKAGDPGCHMTIHNGVLIRKKRPYPRKDGGEVLHYLPWIPRPDRHRDLGAGEVLVEAQRSFNRIVNQITTWRNHIIVPQLLAPEGSIITEPTDEDGAIVQFRPISGMAPEWRQVPDIPQSLFLDLDRCLEDMDEILGSHQLPEGVESGSAIERVNERDQSFRALFIRNLAATYGDLGDHLLELAVNNYTEPRLVEAEGMFGPDRIPDFLGRQLHGVGKVRVSPDAIRPRTREDQESRIMFFVDRQWVEPHLAMKALKAGNADVIVNEVELDQAKQQREIRQMQTLEARMSGDYSGYGGRLAALEDQGRLDQRPIEFPMPTPEDNHEVHSYELRLWMKTRDFEREHPMVQEWARDHDLAHQQYIQLAQLEEQQQQAQQAVAQGDANAARQPSTGRPSKPSEDTLAGEEG